MLEPVPGGAQDQRFRSTDTVSEGNIRDQILRLDLDAVGRCVRRRGRRLDDLESRDSERLLPTDQVGYTTGGDEQLSVEVRLVEHHHRVVGSDSRLTWPGPPGCPVPTEQQTGTPHVRGRTDHGTD